MSTEDRLARALYENEPPRPQQPWANLSEETREHYRQYARNLTAAKETSVNKR